MNARNEPNPTSLDISSFVWYRTRVCQVEFVTPQGLYLIRDVKRPHRTWWVRPNSVMPCPYEQNGRVDGRV